MKRTFYLIMACALLLAGCEKLGPSVYGTVTDKENTPIQGATVYMLLPGQNISAVSGILKTTSDSNGEYKITGLEKDTPYTLKVTANGYEDYQQNNISVSSGKKKIDVCMEKELGYVVLTNIAIQKNSLGLADYETARIMCMHSNLGGYTDWRLPTRAEAAMIYKKRGELGLGIANFWCLAEGNQHYYHYSYFYDGHQEGISTTSPDSEHYVWAVRTITQ